MGKKKTQRRREPRAPAAQGFGGMAALLQAQGLQARQPVEPLKPSPPAAQPAQGRVVLRQEKKGRKGKTVTTLNGLGLDRPQLEAMARRLRRTLGCGSSIDGEQIVLQGDQRGPAGELLESEGWRAVRG